LALESKGEGTRMRMLRRAGGTAGER
jgi:hypothetical protein